MTNNCEKNKWVNGWGLGVAHPPLNEAQWAKDMTVRYVIINTLDSDKIRLHFTNRFGPEKAELTHVTVAISSDGKDAIISDTMTDVTFNGSLTGVMEPYGDIVSDDIPFKTKCGDRIAVSMYFGDFTRLNTGFTYDNKYFVRRFIEGDNTRSESFDKMKMGFSTSYNFLWSIDFLCSEDSYAIEAYGDSLTSQEWVDIVAMHLCENEDGKRAIVRRAVSGSRIFGSYPALSYFHYGEDGKTRFEREITHPGVKEVIIFHGINDLIHPDGKNPMRPMSNMPSVEQMAEALTWYEKTAQKLGYGTYLATLLPIYGWRTYDEPRDKIRLGVNDWIRSSYSEDRYFDFEKAVRDPENPTHFLDECDRGDHLHASVEGYRRMAEIVIKRLFS